MFLKAAKHLIFCFPLLHIVDKQTLHFQLISCHQWRIVIEARWNFLMVIVILHGVAYSGRTSLWVVVWICKSTESRMIASILLYKEYDAAANSTQHEK